MIRFTQGDILRAEVEALVNTVNCVGVMGRGIALKFKAAYPENFKAYAAACERGEVQPGRMFVHPTGALTGPRLVVNFPTKRHWRGKSRIEDIRSGLEDLVAVIRDRGIRSIAVPPLGSGLGGLDWSEVRRLIEQALGALSDVEVVVYEPGGHPQEARANRSTEVPKMTPGRAALVGLMSRYLSALMDPAISLLEVHKLLYFLQEAGEPLRLKFKKAFYGPYAENLRHVLRAVEGHLISGYKPGGDAPEQQLALVPGAVEDAETFLAGAAGTPDRMQRVARLVEGFETSFGLELLATVHWVATREDAPDDERIVQRTHAWGSRKLQFTPRQIGLAADRLRAGGWLPKTDVA